MKKWSFSPDSTAQFLKGKNVELENKSLLKIKLYAVYGFKENKEEAIPISATTSPDGFTGGFKWIPDDITLEVDSTGRKLNYSVSGTLEWKLMNLTLYYQSKTYEGSFDIEGGK